MKRRFNLLCLFALGLFLFTLQSFAGAGVDGVMDDIVTRLYATKTPAELRTLTQEDILEFITPEEKRVLATRTCYFDVNVPVTVSVIRSASQDPVPFWLEEAGFVNTGDQVTSDWYTHEVWRKDFPAGRVELGINGFDNERKAYFVCVGPQDPEDTVELSNRYPDEAVIRMGPQAWTYRDWNDLYIETYPEYLEGQLLLTTYRGRGREAHLVGGFRETAFPASPRPDQVTLTWSEDPRTTQTIQWRTDPSVKDGVVQFAKAPDGPSQTVAAELEVVEDRKLMNDRYIHHYTAVLRGLAPGTAYTYRVGSSGGGEWSEEARFTTAPEAPTAFSFMYTGDTHKSETWGGLLQTAFERHPEMAFNVIGGDLVSTGLNRDEWDRVLHFGKDVYNRKPLMFSLGNHDDQDGLGVGLILSMFRFPDNGPAGVERGRIYTFTYSNAQFFVVDVGTDIETVAPWLERELARSKATWKFFIYHFPLYNDGEYDYSNIAGLWGPIFDTHHVDFALHGHFHRYFRTKPIRGGKVVDSPADGTIYIHTVGVASGDVTEGSTEIAAKWIDQGQLYQKFDIDGNRLQYKTYDIEGRVRDAFVIEKPEEEAGP